MPYINKDARADMDGFVRNPLSEGELNYVITREIDGWLRRQGTNYSTLNAVIGVLECAKLELYRRVAAPYEDRKCNENGDVYGR